MMRRQVLQWMTAAGAMKEINTSSASQARSIDDDGVMELRPEYNVQRVQGEPRLAVFARFGSVARSAAVQLRAGDTISINGQVLTGELHSSGYMYRGELAASQSRIQFVLKRASQPEMRHEVSMPSIGVAELPAQYRRYQTLRVPVAYDEPPGYVNERYDMSIMSPPLRFSLVSTTRSKEHRYEFGRLPDIREGAIVFRPINEFGLTAGVYPAKLFRQHHIALRDLSPSTPSGWVYLTNTVNFSVEVV